MFSFTNKKSYRRLKLWGGLDEEDFQNGGFPFFVQQGTADVLLFRLELNNGMITSHTVVFSWFEQAVQAEYM